MPEFPGGQQGLTEFLIANVEYPEFAKKNNIEGKVYVTFIVNEKGEVVNPKIQPDGKKKKELQGESEIKMGPMTIDEITQQDYERYFPAKTLAEAAIDVVKKMPNWTPGENGGKKVAVYFTLPISFKL